MKTKQRAAQSVLTGVWHNQHNSEIHLEVDESGKVSGQFITGIRCPGDSCETFPLTGFANGDVFAFCVDFSQYGSMTTWVGQIVAPESKTFQAAWQMIVDVYQQKDMEWKSTWVGQDEFQAGGRKSEVSTVKRVASHPKYCSII